MNSVIDAILTRRSIRSFEDRHISSDDLKLIAKCAIHAPSARNRQLWHFTVVSNRQTLSRLAAAVAKAIGADSSYNFYGPDALIIASAPRDYRFGREDCSCALENIFIAAHSLGIGTVWINQLCDICDDGEVRKILDELGVPKDNIICGSAALGYPANPAPEMTKDSSVINFVD